MITQMMILTDDNSDDSKYINAFVIYIYSINSNSGDCLYSFKLSRLNIYILNSGIDVTFNYRKNVEFAN